MTKPEFNYILDTLLDPFQLNRDSYHHLDVYDNYCEFDMGPKVLIKNIKETIPQYLDARTQPV